jgi:Transposase DNA-binding/Transposase Tn5 dimerisation domain
MGTSLKTPSAWARQSFAAAQLGDARRTRRLVRVASALAQRPSGLLPRAMPAWAELKAAYRLFAGEDVTHERISAPHREQSAQACRRPGEYLLVEDTTDLDFTSHGMSEGLGPIGDGGGRGMYVHSTLALRIEGWDRGNEPAVGLLGLAAQNVWVREEQKVPDRLETRRQRLSRQRESERWAAVFDEIGGPPAGSRWTYVADRESDIYEVFERCKRKGVDWVVRARLARALAEEGDSLFDAAAGAPVQGRCEVRLRARPGQRARTAQVELRSAAVTVRGPWRPQRRLPPMSLNVVQAHEVNAEGQKSPILWVLLTSWPVEGQAACVRVVKAYTQRWLIEEYHKALKTGAGMEQSQLCSAGALQALLGVLAIVAVRLLSMKLLARSAPQEAVEPQSVGAQVLAILEAKLGRPQEGWTHRTLLVRIARLGGFLARKGDGLPGWQTLWRGWDVLMILVQGYDLMHNAESCG